jgi:hypothetical protein
MRRLRLVKGARVKTREGRGQQDVEQRFRFPAEEIWEVSCEDRRKPAPRISRSRAQVG